MSVVPTPRQTIPFGDRPFVDEKGHLTIAAYQYLSRLSVGVGATIENVTTITGDFTTIEAEIATLQGEVVVINNEITTIETEISLVSAGIPPPAGLPSIGTAFYIPPIPQPSEAEAIIALARAMIWFGIGP